MVQLSEVTRKAAADAIATLIAACHVRLYKTAYMPEPGSDIGSFVECDFGGYADVAATSILTIRDDGTGDWLLVPVGPFSFVADNTITAPQDAFGLFVTNAAGTVLYASEAFDVPFHYAADLDGLVLDPIELRMPYSV